MLPNLPSLGGVLTTDLFCKPTDTHQFLHKKSCHPWHTKKAIPYSQALRYRRICSEDRQFRDRVGNLAGWLKDRGYEESIVNEQIDRVRRLDRETLPAETDRGPNPGRGDRIPLVITYHPAFNSVGKTIRSLHSMLSNSEEHREVFPEPPVTAFRRCKNLKDLLVMARLATYNNCDERGCTRCEKSRCQVCKSMSESDSFYSHATSKEYKSNFRLTVIPRVLCICLSVLCVVFSMWVVLTRLLGLGLIIIRRVIVGLGQGLQFPRWTFSDIFLRKDIMGSWKTFVSLLLIN